MNLQNLVKQIQEKTVVANDDLKDATNNTRPMREGLKRAAKEQLEDLKNEYQKELLKSVSFIVVTGPQANELLSLGAKGITVHDENAFYEEVLERIDSRSYINRLVDGTYFQALTFALEEVAGKIGIRSFPQLNFKAEYSKMITTKAEALALTRKVVLNEIGGEFVGVFAVNYALNTLISNGHVYDFLPVFLNSSDEQETIKLTKDLSLLSQNVFLVNAGGKLPKALKSIPNSLSVKEANQEALDQVLEAVKSKSV